MRSIVFAIALTAVPVVACHADEKFGELTPQQVSAKLKDKNVYIFDNNDPADYKSGHIPHAKWLHPEEYEAKDLPADKNATLIFYCMNEH